MSVTDASTVFQQTSVADQFARARAVFATGRTKPISWRIAQLEGLLRFVDDCESEIADAISADLGRGSMATFMADVGPVRHEIRHTLADLHKWVKPTSIPITAATAPGKAWSQPEPKGTVAILGAWNFPLLLTIQPLVSALAAGNTAVVKPSEISGTTADLIARRLPQHVDGEAVQVVCGGVETSAALLDLPFDHIFFTGSTTVGRLVMEAAAKHLSPVTLELGGKSPVIVAADADIEVAARRIAWAKSINGGQACISPDYVLVEESVRPALVSALLRELPARAQHDSTRIVNRGHLERLRRLLDTHGGEQFGGVIDDDKLTVSPALVTDPHPKSPLMTEEIFGPILPLVSVPSVAAAVRFVNDRPKPLSLYAFTGSGATEKLILDGTSSGSVGINQAMYQILVPELPFGGVGDSGMGRYHGRHGFDTFTHHKAVLRKPISPDLSMTYPPYGSSMQRLLRKLMG
ncbi:aldehyde dehydrogenase family protein [Gordonia soli]|uniref:Aldehyde dehydrogenase n=1 Tax=Gordonia soli NBRC 108243 TaxID=1223545 RepID=M0QIY1_9ACTN|nr:aldehyde dehydrogenase family protein [Gordonia soli]GAC68518.1 putative aldehyde dehydrogenase [Gordonia soli NBRC 108243]